MPEEIHYRENLYVEEVNGLRTAVYAVDEKSAAWKLWFMDHPDFHMSAVKVLHNG